ncbi:hypothetical protein KMZ29_13650 [Bradyrhizobium sediminis]|uniref:Uncharacterized protein n=1 Tax=Bradyrhizobium sediminis TaxID=2840469 RepID=A0A975NAB3_9BRAD|nr:hypothetical protein [Bradyrhizobium sediminis]QWG10836.1 hypothetical protein KMZ29_13650 [Bradyrhizobium sediminis]
MSTVGNHLAKAAEDAANSAQERIASFDRQLADIEKKKADIEANRAALRGSLQRLANFPVKSGANYLCPLCWVDEGKMSPLAPVASDNRDDIFRCRMCHYEAVIPG